MTEPETPEGVKATNDKMSDGYEENISQKGDEPKTPIKKIFKDTIEPPATPSKEPLVIYILEVRIDQESIADVHGR